jgi:hypothetical protein
MTMVIKFKKRPKHCRRAIHDWVLSSFAANSSCVHPLLLNNEASA